jgi:GT2 family glycosyltransferase
MSRRYSIITPVYDPPADVLEEAIDSVRNQTHPYWELILVDDASPSSHVRPILRAAAAADDRIIVVEREQNGGIVAASNDGLQRATGEFVGLLDHDDTLEPAALELVDSYADRHPEMDYCYSDEDLLSPDGHYVAPFYKPDWSPERLRSQNYCGHFSVFSSSLLAEIGGFRAGFDGSQDYDLFLRATEEAREIVHIPYVLYHWRQIPTSVAAGDPSVKPYAYQAGRRAIQEHCDRVGIDAEVEMAEHLGNYHIRRRVATDDVTSIIIPTCGATGRVWGFERCFVVEAIRSVADSTSRPIEFVVVFDSGMPKHLLSLIRNAAGDRPLKLVEFDRPFNFSEKINLGVIHSTGEFVLLLNDDIEVITDEFLDPLIGLAAESSVGAVGCKMYFADGRIQHAGHVYNGNPHHIMYGRASYEVGPGGLLVVQREVIGVTGACMMLRRDLFLRVGGLCAALPGNFNDVDLNLKIRGQGLNRIWTPQVEMYHFESASRDPSASMEEWQFVADRWGEQMYSDPYFNPNLEPDRNDWVEKGLR